MISQLSVATRTPRAHKRPFWEQGLRHWSGWKVLPSEFRQLPAPVLPVARLKQLDGLVFVQGHPGYDLNRNRLSPGE